MFDLTTFNRNAAGQKLDDFTKLVNTFFKNEATAGIFKMDVKEKDDKYLIDADLPGVDKGDINVEVKNGYLTIAVKHEDKKEEKNDEGKYLHKERHMSAMQRTVYFPDIKNDGIEAKYDNGVLHIAIPKIAATAPPKIEIK